MDIESLKQFVKLRVTIINYITYILCTRAVQPYQRVERLTAISKQKQQAEHFSTVAMTPCAHAFTKAAN